ncbi:MAG: hypothetical protein AAF441_18115 [Pseudomonadota bacterium]
MNAPLTSADLGDQTLEAFVSRTSFHNPSDPASFAEDCQRLAENISLLIRVHAEFWHTFDETNRGDCPLDNSFFQFMGIVERQVIELHAAALKASDAAQPRDRSFVPGVSANADG